MSDDTKHGTDYLSEAAEMLGMPDRIEPSCLSSQFMDIVGKIIFELARRQTGRVEGADAE